jgi:hypothetical protein
MVVTRIPPMHRAYRTFAWMFIALCVVLVMTSLRRKLMPQAMLPAVPTVPTVVPSSTADAAEWFRRVKPYCNAVEIAVLQRQAPPPETLDGAGYHAACFALAGRIDDARHIIDGLPAQQRYRAVGIVFDVGHPVADAGDDRSAGPIMELVIDYWPNHYMALYHAGMAEYMLGQRDLARRNLTAFLQTYRERDGWRSNGLEVLRRLDDTTTKQVELTRPREPGQ